MTTRTRLSVLLVSTPLLAFIVLGGLRGRAAGGDERFQHLRVFEDVVSLILNNYVETARIDRVMEGAMRGMADGLIGNERGRLDPSDMIAKMVEVIPASQGKFRNIHPGVVED